MLKKQLFWPFFALSVFLQSVEKMPSVQSFVATSSRPNIWGAVMALGFMRISLWGWPHSEKKDVDRDIKGRISTTPNVLKQIYAYKKQQFTQWFVRCHFMFEGRKDDSHFVSLSLTHSHASFNISRFITSLCLFSWTYIPKHAQNPTCHSSHQRVYTSCLSGPTRSQGHHAMSDPLSLKQLDDLQLPGRVNDQTCVLHLREINYSIRNCSSTVFTILII